MKNKTWLIIWFLIILYPSVSLSQQRQGLNGSVSYTYETRDTANNAAGVKDNVTYFLQKYNLDYKKTIPLLEGSLGVFDAALGAGYDVIDRDSNGKDYHIDAFKKNWLFHLVLTPTKMPIFFEALTEKRHWSSIDKDSYSVTQYVSTHNKIGFKYVIPRYFNLFDPRSGNGAGNAGNGNGLSWTGNGNGLSWTGNGNGAGNGGLLGGNGNGFFSGNGNGGNGGNGNGRWGKRVGPLVPYAYLFNWDNYQQSGDNIGKNNTNRYTLNLGFLRFWVNTAYDVREEMGSKTEKGVFEIGQKRYDGRLLWTLLNNWINAASYFVYTTEKTNAQTTLETYEGNFLFKTYRSTWNSDLPSKITYEQRPSSNALRVRLPYYFYGSISPTSSFGGGLTYELNKVSPENTPSTTENRINNNLSFGFRKGDWNINSRHDLVIFVDDVKNSNDYTTFNYKIDLKKLLTPGSRYSQSGNYELSLHKYTEGPDEKLRQIHTGRYGISGPISSNLSFSVSESLSYYNEGKIPVTTDNYIAQNRVVDVQMEPGGRSIRNAFSAGLSYKPLYNLGLSVSGALDDVFYDNGTESKRTLTGGVNYTALERVLTMTGDASYSTMNRLSETDEDSYTASLRVNYTPFYNLKSVTSVSTKRTETRNGVATFTENKEISEELTYSYYISDYGTRKLFDVRARAKAEKYANLSPFGSDKFQGQKPFAEKTVITYEGGASYYPYRHITFSGSVKNEQFKENGDNVKENLSYTLNFGLNFPLLSFNALYQEIKERIDAYKDERRLNINVTKRF